MKKIITIMVAVAVSSLAAIAQPYPTTDNIVRLTDQNMPAVEYFTLEKVKLPEKYADAQYFVYNDSVLIIINNQRPQPFVVTFYNLNTKKEIAGFFLDGTWSDRISKGGGRMYQNTLIVGDGFARIIARLNVDSVLTEKYAYKPAITRLTSVRSCVFVDENTITMANPMYISDEYGVEGLPEFIQFDAKTGKPLANYKQNDKNYPANMTSRSIAYSNSKYIAFWSNYPIITIYDKDFNLIKMYRDDKFEDNEVREEYSEYLMKSTFATKNIDNFFAFANQTDNYIFAFNGRGHISREEFEKKGGILWVETTDFTMARFKNLEIWCFDNNMNLVRRFKCKNKICYIRCISYNEKSKKLFVNAMDENEKYCLYRCKFKK